MVKLLLYITLVGHLRVGSSARPLWNIVFDNLVADINPHISARATGYADDCHITVTEDDMSVPERICQNALKPCMDMDGLLTMASPLARPNLNSSSVLSGIPQW